MAEALTVVFQTTLLPSFSSQFHHHHYHNRLSFPKPICTPKTHHTLTPIQCSIPITATPSTASAVERIPWGCEADSVKNAEALQDWLTKSGLPSQKMRIERVDVGEGGLVANNNIRRERSFSLFLLLLLLPLIRYQFHMKYLLLIMSGLHQISITYEASSANVWPINIHCLVSYETLFVVTREWSCPEAGNVLKKNSVPDWPLLATYLIIEASLMSSSRWSNYISALPRQPYSLLYRTRSELDRYLEASQIRERAIERSNDIIGTFTIWRRLDGHLASFSHDWYDYLQWMVFISYGKKSNGELLLSYGFVPKEGTNPSDSAELSLSLKKSEKCYKEKLDALKKYGLSGSHCFPLQVTGWPVEMMAYAYLVVSPPSMLQQFDKMAAVASNKTGAKKNIRYPEIDEQAFQFILDTCEASIAKYTKFLQASGSMDLDVTSPKQLNRRLFLKQLAVDLCNSERRILYRTQYILRRRLTDIRSGELKALRLFDGFRNWFE
uniref:Rubisco LSMT substrate-binding domain-containing protein n=1 Tax=Chenopodium quinoa TaxID=63459 RepID=A0A803MVF0_CHEQI